MILLIYKGIPGLSGVFYISLLFVIGSLNLLDKSYAQRQEKQKQRDQRLVQQNKNHATNNNKRSVT